MRSRGQDRIQCAQIVLREDACERENGAIDHDPCLTQSEGEREVWRDCCEDSSRELPLRGALGVKEEGGAWLLVLTQACVGSCRDADEAKGSGRDAEQI